MTLVTLFDRPSLFKILVAAMGSVTAVFDLLIGFALGIGNGLAIVAARALRVLPWQR